MRQTHLLERAIAVQNMVAESADVASFGAGPLNALADFLHADNAVLFSLQPSATEQAPLLARAVVDLDVSELQDYLDHFYQHDPIVQFIRRKANQRTSHQSKNYGLFRLADVCSQNSFSRTKYYREFFRGTGIDDVLAFNVLPDTYPSFPVLIGFHRRGKNRAFGAEEMMRGRLIAPVLSSCLSRLMAAERFHLLESATQTYADKASSNRSVFMVDQQLNCGFQFGSSAPLSQSVLDKIRKACQSLSAENVPRTSILVDAEYTSAKGKTVLDIERTISRFGVYFIVSMQTAEARNPADQGAEWWGLTARETDVVHEMYQGTRNAEIASTLGISMKTVENHISSIFSKAGVASRLELVSRLATQRVLN